MANHYSANRRNICLFGNNPRNRLAATSLKHNLQYCGYPGNIQSSNYRRNCLSETIFKHNMTSRQPYFIPTRADRFNNQRNTWQGSPCGSQRLNHYGGGRSRNKQHSQLDNGVLGEWNTNPNFIQTNFSNSKKNNHYDIRQNNSANLNNNRNRQYRIPDSGKHDWNGNFQNSMEVDVSKDDEETKFDITEAAGTPRHTHDNQNWCKQPLESNNSEENLAESSQIYSDGSLSPTYLHGNWKWRNVESNNDSEEDLTFNSQISDGGLNYVHSNFNCNNQSRDCSESEDLDVHSEISDVICRQEQLAESSQIYSDRSPSPTYSHGNCKWRNLESNNDSEEDLTTNSQISDGSLTYIHSNFKCNDQSRDCSDSEDLDVHSEISDTIYRQDIEITPEESDPTIHDLRNLTEQTETEDDSILLPDNTSDEWRENTPPAENDRSTLCFQNKGS